MAGPGRPDHDRCYLLVDEGVQLTRPVSQSLAFAVSVLAGGVVADRFKRSNVMAAADLIRLVAVAGFMLLPIQAHLGLLVLCGVLMGGGQALFAPAQRALIPALVPNEVIQSANALITTSSRTAGIVGRPSAVWL